MAEVRQQRGSSGAEVSAISGSSQVWTEGPLAGEYLRGALHPALAKQVYEYSSEELMNRVDKSAVSGLDFISALIDRVHNAGRLIRSLHGRILTLRAANKEPKLSANQELLAATEHRAKEWEDEAKKSQTELESLRNQRRELELEQEVGFLRFSLDGARNDRVIGLQRSVVRFHLFPLRQVGYRRGKRVILVRFPNSGIRAKGRPPTARSTARGSRLWPSSPARGRPATAKAPCTGSRQHARSPAGMAGAYRVTLAGVGSPHGQAARGSPTARAVVYKGDSSCRGSAYARRHRTRSNSACRRGGWRAASPLAQGKDSDSGGVVKLREEG
ncbi:hypothetical protein BHM03_00047423 [Ensete ventricosum]|nr:hypothetical protein BHM03_00047423 [Ensete ventricosum]